MYAIRSYYDISKFNFTEGLSTIKRTNQEKQLELVYQYISEVQDEKDLLDRITSYNVCYTKLLRQLKKLLFS